MNSLTAGTTLCGGIAASLVLFAGPSRPDTKTTLHIGTTETVVEENVPEGSDETAVQAAYRQFIQATTGFDSHFVALDNHEVLAERLASGSLQLGVFMGYEFAWAQARHPKLKVLAFTVNQNLFRYPALVVHRDGPVSGFADLKGETLALPRRGHGEARLFIAAQCRLAGQDPGAFLGDIASFEDVETPLDDVVAGTQQAAVVDRLCLEAYQRQKPGRFARLKILSESAPMPPALIAYYEGNLPPQSVARIRDKLTKAHMRKKGVQLPMLFRLTRFVSPSHDFDRVLADARTTYPAPAPKKWTSANPELATVKLLPHPAGSAPVSTLVPEPGKRGSEYYLCVFAFERARGRAQHAHTFATFVKSSGASVEAHTISWLPKSKHIDVGRTRSEPGRNLDLHQTLRLARDVSASVYQWGPYRIRSGLYDRSLRQLERLNSGRIQYKALDGAGRPDAASNCIHAVSDVDAGHGYLTVDGACGVLASARVAEHLSHWMIQPGLEQDSINEMLGLSDQPITRVEYFR